MPGGDYKFFNLKSLQITAVDAWLSICQIEKKNPNQMYMPTGSLKNLMCASCKTPSPDRKHN